MLPSYYLKEQESHYHNYFYNELYVAGINAKNYVTNI